MSGRDWRYQACFLFLLCMAVALPAQTFTTLHSFDGTDGSDPTAALVQAINGNLYGTTCQGGTNSYGTVFKFTPSGTLATLYRFCGQGGSNCTDGAYPSAGLVQATSGSLYGTTTFGGTGTGAPGRGPGMGPPGHGTVFKITPAGVLTTLYSFCMQSGCADGSDPSALAVAPNGSFYGTTYSGGANNSGTVFKTTPAGALSTLYSFCSQSSCPDGQNPVAGLVQGTDGNFYGTTFGGGANSLGTAFKITPSGVLTTLHSFSGGSEGEIPSTALIQSTNGIFYGTTAYGGANGEGTVYSITSGGTLATLLSFDGTDGFDAGAALLQGTDGNFYGTTYAGGTTSSGTIFKVTPAGVLTTLHNFVGTDGIGPSAALVQDTSGKFYGTTA